MLSRMRKTYDAAFKAKVAFEAAKGEKTIAQIASAFSVHPNQIRLWRNHLMDELPELFFQPPGASGEGPGGAGGGTVPADRPAQDGSRVAK